MYLLIILVNKAQIGLKVNPFSKKDTKFKKLEQLSVLVKSIAPSTSKVYKK